MTEVSPLSALVCSAHYVLATPGLIAALHYTLHAHIE